MKENYKVVLLIGAGATLAEAAVAFSGYRYLARSILRFRGMGRLQITDSVPV
jgi:hypothetical protein